MGLGHQFLDPWVNPVNLYPAIPTHGRGEASQGVGVGPRARCTGTTAAALACFVMNRSPKQCEFLDFDGGQLMRIEGEVQVFIHYTFIFI
jgi:hypothetical protein